MCGNFLLYYQTTVTESERLQTVDVIAHQFKNIK